MCFVVYLYIMGLPDKLDLCLHCAGLVLGLMSPTYEAVGFYGESCSCLNNKHEFYLAFIRLTTPFTPFFLPLSDIALFTLSAAKC